MFLVLNRIESQFFVNIVEFEFNLGLDRFVAENEHFLDQIQELKIVFHEVYERPDH